MKKFNDAQAQDHGEADTATDAPKPQENEDRHWREGAVPPPRDDDDRRDSGDEGREREREREREPEGTIPSPREDSDKRRPELHEHGVRNGDGHGDGAPPRDWSPDSLKEMIQRDGFDEVRGKVGVFYSGEYKKDDLHGSVRDKLTPNSEGLYRASDVAKLHRDAYPDTSVMIQDTKIGKMLTRMENEGPLSETESKSLWKEASASFAEAVREKGVGSVSFVRESQPGRVFQDKEFPQLKIGDKPMLSDEVVDPKTNADLKKGRFEIHDGDNDDQKRWPAMH